MKALGTFTVSVSAGDPRKVSSFHNSLRTKASASAKVGWLLWYQATCLKVPAACLIRRCANSVTSENSPKSAGVVRRIAKSDHCLCVRLESQMSTHLLEGHFQLPAHHKPGEDLLRIGVKVGTQEGLGFELFLRIAHQHPTQRYGE